MTDMDYKFEVGRSITNVNSSGITGKAAWEAKLQEKEFPGANSFLGTHSQGLSSPINCLPGEFPA